MSGGEWDPIAHHDADEPPAKPATKPKPKGKKKSTGGVPAPVGMMLMVPPDFIAAISSLAGTQERIASGIEKLVAEMKAQREKTVDPGA
ncbi:MAG TPA: hypothetical protein VNU68_35015 [Verrucomicrobiae bacterium]|nr:hypothetical protein [Verrucomicrobiae bacterium]